MSVEVQKARVDRSSPWRQGSVLGPNSVALLGLELSPGAVLVVISHDCDLAEQSTAREPNVELILGELKPSANGSLKFGKSPRTLHLSYQNPEGMEIVVELSATKKRIEERTAWFFEHQPDANYWLTPQNIGVLRSWLSTRYERAAFSNSFVTRMSIGKTAEALANKFKNDDCVSQIYFNVDKGQEKELDDAEQTHTLEIVLAYLPGSDPEQNEYKAEKVAEEVEELFTKNFFDAQQGFWKFIRLKSCMAISEDDVTISLTRKLSEWRLEYLSHRNPEIHVMPSNRC
ncbi:MAG: hypothetical protein RLO04_10070 [Limnobacter sp.]|uniref:hypothetical protein n=1 Tax=Limnobacter sp. TaxID=2003368 RepID=UPI0032EFD4FF